MTTTTTDYGRERHREWMARQIKGLAPSGVVFEDVSPTYVIRLANPSAHIAWQVAKIIGNHGANLVHGSGLWEGTVEPDVTITIQATPRILDVLVHGLAQYYPQEDYLHVERHDVPTSYVELSTLR